MNNRTSDAHKDRRWDVIVVGARVAGAATAMLLARAGLRVLCVDRSRYGGDTVSTHALMRGGVLQLQRWGVLDAVADAGTPPVRRTVFHYGAESVAVSIRPAAGVDALYAPRRTVIDALLVDAAQRAGATVEFGATVAGLARDTHGRVAGVTIEDRRAGASHGADIDRGPAIGRIAGIDSRAGRIERAPLVIGADGRNSLVARITGATPSTVGRWASSYLYGYWADFPSDGYEWFYRPGLTAGAIPTNAGLTCVFVGAHPDRMQDLVSARSPLAALQLLAEPAGIGQRLRDAVRVEPVRYSKVLPPGYLRPAYGPGWALVGDAGHWIDPISTHGMTAALRDAELLSQAVLSAPPDGARLQSALAGYQATRDRLSLPMLRVTEEIASYRWDLTGIRTLLRTLSSAMTDEVEALSALAAVA
jgi:2-polyprenyl-6-methoxyphenol hydroxylase-like FAD-dependent oxidoreductase